MRPCGSTAWRPACRQPPLERIGAIGAVAVHPPLFINPPVWTASASLPGVPAGRVGRLIVREFERYYTDRTVPETRAGGVRRRVVIEERLVYAEVFDLP